MEYLGVVLDGVVILLLFGTIIFAAKLSLQLKAFRDSRAQFDTVIRDLDMRIAAAQESILGLRQAASDNGGVLQEKIDDAQSLYDELSLMTQAADSLAHRLENAADSGHILNRDEPDIEEARIYDLDKKGGEAAKAPNPQKFEERLRRIEEKSTEENTNAPLQSQAERDLADALLSKKKGKA